MVNDVLKVLASMEEDRSAEKNRSNKQYCSWNGLICFAGYIVNPMLNKVYKYNKNE